MKPLHSYQPVRYYTATLLITWLALFTTAWLSHDDSLATYQFLGWLIALITPCTVALFMIFRSKDKALIEDFKRRLFNLKLIKPGYLPALLLIVPLATLAATAISLLFGQPVEQFRLSPEFTLAESGVIMLLIPLILAPTFEELGWRGYGVDSLLKKGRSLLGSTLLFAILWNLWHLPLFFIKGYYHYELIQMNPVYALNFVVSLFPAAFLMNWLYYKNNRSIPLIILFHAILNLSSVMLQTEQFTKCIITILLLIVSAVILWRNQGFFLEKKTGTTISTQLKSQL